MRKVMAPIPDGPNNREHLWKPGQSGNPSGRRPHSRNRLTEAFLKDMIADWEANGAKAIVTFREERPHEYVKLFAGLLPRKFEMKVSEYDELSDEQLDARLGAAIRGLAASGFDVGAATGMAEGAQPPLALPALPKAEGIP
jgi:hypothetical protein